MQFNTMEFALFLPVVLVVHWLLRNRYRNRWLLLASYVFYGFWDARFLVLLAVSTMVDFLVGLAMESRPDQRKTLLAISVSVNLGILGAFKYFGFFVESMQSLLGDGVFAVDSTLLSIVLPVGISFYTFQSMSYTFDVFRGRLPPVRDLPTFALYVAFFPQLVAGPIERAHTLLPQLMAERRIPTSDTFVSAIFLIILGLFRKVVLADMVAPMVRTAFASPSGSSRIELIVGVVAFSLQIYGDFAGYSDIARGVSRLFGIELMRNFEQPYLSRNISEFWRTWHVSLSSWLHDYLYVPLGGNRGSRLATYRNLAVTMLLGGLWHGASWTFLIWGAIHGVFLGLHRMSGAYVARGAPARLDRPQTGRTLATFAVVSLAWIWFRAESATQATEYFRSLAFNAWLPMDVPAIGLLGFLWLVTLGIDVAQRQQGDHVFTQGSSALTTGVIMGLAVVGIIIGSGGQVEQFIYFQF